MENKRRVLWKLFVSTLYLSAFTFGGGYAMLALLENEFVIRRKWISREDFLTMTAISKSTPAHGSQQCYLSWLADGWFCRRTDCYHCCLHSFLSDYLPDFPVF